MDALQISVFGNQIAPIDIFGPLSRVLFPLLFPGGRVGTRQSRTQAITRVGKAWAV